MTSLIAIIGSGLAGCCASLEILRSSGNTNVVMLEKESTPGGNSSKATSGINACCTKAQSDLSLPDSVDTFYGDTFTASRSLAMPGLVRILVEKSAEAISFLEEQVSFVEDVPAPLEIVSRNGGHSCCRTHRFDPLKTTRGFGGELLKRLHSVLASSGSRFELRLGCRVVNLRKSDSKFVIGFADEEVADLHADAVVVASGGYGANTALIRTVLSDQTYPTTNGLFSTGDAFEFLSGVGASPRNLELVQIHPTGIRKRDDPDATKVFLAPEALRAYGGILVDAAGHRFVDELTTRDVVAEKIQTASAGVARLMLNKEAVENFGMKYFRFYEIKGLVIPYENWDRMCEGEGLDSTVVAETVRSYNSFVGGDIADEFGKSVFPVQFAWEEACWLVLVSPAVHYTMGGVAISERAEVLTPEDEVIPGLFAAGECTTGVHGANRLAGNSLLECVVFGRIAGKNAALLTTNEE